MKLIYGDDENFATVSFIYEKEQDEVNKYLMAEKKDEICRGWLINAGFDGCFVIRGHTLRCDANGEIVAEFSLMFVVG